MKKRLISILLVLVLLATAMPALPAMAATGADVQTLVNSYASGVGPKLFENLWDPLVAMENNGTYSFDRYAADEAKLRTVPEVMQQSMKNPFTFHLREATMLTWVSSFHRPDTLLVNPVLVISKLDLTKSDFNKVVESIAYPATYLDASTQIAAVVAMPDAVLQEGDYAISVRSSATVPGKGFDVLSDDSLLYNLTQVKQFGDGLVTTANSGPYYASLTGAFTIKGISDYTDVTPPLLQQTDVLQINKLQAEKAAAATAATDAASKAAKVLEDRLARLAALPMDINGFNKSIDAAAGSILFDNYYKMMCSQKEIDAYLKVFTARNTKNQVVAGPRSGLSFKLGTPTKLTWLASYHIWWAETKRDNMIMVVSSINPKGSGVNKVTKSWYFPAKWYYFNGRFQFVSTPNMTFPAGEYALSIRSAEEEIAGPAMDYESDDSLLMSAQDLGTKADTDMIGGFTIKGVPSKLPKGVLAFTRTTTLNYGQLVADLNAYWAAVDAAAKKAAAQKKAVAASQPKITMNGATTGMKAYIYGGATFVPVRPLAEALDFSVAFDAKTQKLRIADNDTGVANIIFTVGRDSMQVMTASGWYDDRIMPATARIIGGTLYVPLSSLSNALGLKYKTVNGVLQITGGIG